MGHSFNNPFSREVASCCGPRKTGQSSPPENGREVVTSRAHVINSLLENEVEIGSESAGLPAKWKLNGTVAGPGKFLAALLQAAQGKDDIRVPANVGDEPKLVKDVGLDKWSYGKWLYAPGFEGENNLALARRMAWTLCPA